MAMYEISSNICGRLYQSSHGQASSLLLDESIYSEQPNQDEGETECFPSPKDSAPRLGWK